MQFGLRLEIIELAGHPVRDPAEEEATMRTITLSIAAVALFAGASFAQDDARHRAKFGRNTPQTEARIKAERESTAYRDATRPSAAEIRTADAEARHRAKFGRPTPAEEARINEERQSTAYRDANVDKTVPRQDWENDRHRSKFGRSAPSRDSK
jgi:hypothetical protein